MKNVTTYDASMQCNKNFHFCKTKKYLSLAVSDDSEKSNEDVFYIRKTDV